MRQTIFFIVFFNSVIFGQNLVPNSSFEEIGDSISGFSNSSTEFINSIKYWTTPNGTTPDLITPDFEEGFVDPPMAHSGSNIVGIQCTKHWLKDNYWSECIGVQLSKPLKPNRTYYVEYWIRRSNCADSIGDIDEYMNLNLGILFTLDAIITTKPDMLFGIPQINGDSTILVTNKEWAKVSKYFTPKEKYRYLNFGQFRKENEKNPEYIKSYFVVDDISVVELSDFESLDKSTTLSVGSIIPLNNVNFTTGTTELSDRKSHAVLKELVTYLQTNSSIRIQINGHTDSKGKKENNHLLSEKRARAIAEILVKKGISKNRIEWKGFGEANAISDNNTEKGRSKNRRVEFEVIE